MPQRLTYRPFLSRKAEIGKERIQQVLPRRRTEIGPQAAAHSADLIQQASRNRERASPPSRACPSARCSTPGTTGSEACSSAKRAAWRGALPQEPREANPSGRPTTRETRSPEALFPRNSHDPKSYPASPSHAAIFGAYPKRRLRGSAPGPHFSHSAHTPGSARPGPRWPRRESHPSPSPCASYKTARRTARLREAGCSTR